MSRDEKKAYLSRYRIQQSRILRLSMMMEAFPDSAEHYRRQRQNARMARDRTEAEIAALCDETLREVLAQKYIACFSLCEIADHLNYSKRQIERLHLKALDAFEPFCENGALQDGQDLLY